MKDNSNRNQWRYPTERLINVKKLSTYKFLRMLPRDSQQTKSQRMELLAQHKQNKKEFKDFIHTYKLNGWKMNKSKKTRKLYSR